MKIKSFAILALSGLLAMTIVAPVMADDTGTNDQLNDQSMDQSMLNLSENDPQQNLNNPMENNIGAADEGNTPDTATGDDDY